MSWPHLHPRLPWPLAGSSGFRCHGRAGGRPIAPPVWPACLPSPSYLPVHTSCIWEDYRPEHKGGATVPGRHGLASLSWLGSPWGQATDGMCPSWTRQLRCPRGEVSLLQLLRSLKNWSLRCKPCLKVETSPQSSQFTFVHLGTGEERF